MNGTDLTRDRAKHRTESVFAVWLVGILLVVAGCPSRPAQVDVLLCEECLGAGDCVCTLAGDGVQGRDDGPALEARLVNPHGVDVAEGGAILVTDITDHRIRLLADGTLTTMAGSGAVDCSDGPLLQAGIGEPAGIMAMGSGRIVFADLANHVIREIAEGQVRTIAGFPERGGGFLWDVPARQARFTAPAGVCLGAKGEILVADGSGVRALENDWVRNIAGGIEHGMTDGPVAVATFRGANNVALGPAGEIYVVDGMNNAIRVIREGQVSTLAGKGIVGAGYVDGPRSAAAFRSPSGVAVDRAGRVFVTDNHAIRMIYRDMVSTVAGTGKPGFKDGPAAEAMFRGLAGLVLDGNRLIVTDSARIRAVYLKILSSP